MTTAAKHSMEPRKSTETEQRHLLEESVAPSESASMITEHGEGDRTPRARSPLRAASNASVHSEATETSGSYKGFASEAEYLAALDEWAESKKYLEPETMLVGFYGPKTMQYYASQPRVEVGLKKKWRARKERKKLENQNGRRHTVG